MEEHPKTDKEVKLSNCCGAEPLGGMEEMGFCGRCKDHCEFITDEEHLNLFYKESR